MTDPRCSTCGARLDPHGKPIELRECDVLDAKGIRHGWLCRGCWTATPAAAAPRRPGVMHREWRDGPTHDERILQYNARVAACQCTACGRLGDVTMGVKQATVACSACGVTYVVKSGSRGFKEARLRVQAIDGHGLEGK